MKEKNEAAAAPALEQDVLMRAGRADVFKVRDRSRRKRIIRLVAIFLLIDGYLWWRYATYPPEERGFGFPSLGPDAWIFIPMGLLFAAIALTAMLPLLNGRSPHLFVRPEQIEVGIDDVRGLDTQVDEVRRSLDVFMGYATFREELGGNPRRGILFEGPPGTGKTYLAKAMAKQAGVPFLFIAAPAFQSMWFGATARKIRSYFKALRKVALKEGGAIGFIEEIDAIGGARAGIASSVGDGSFLQRAIAHAGMPGGGDSGMVNELLIQMQSFDQPPLRDRIRTRTIEWVNGFLPPERRFASSKLTYNNILLIAATNRADSLDPALLRPGRFDRRLYFDVPTKTERRELVDWFLERKAHHEQLDADEAREKLAHDTLGYTPVMIEHMFDEALLVSLRQGRRQMNVADVYEAKLTEEVGVKQPVVYTDDDRTSVATHESGHATVAYFLGKGRRLEVLSIIKRRQSLGLLAHGDEEERYTRSRSEIESAVAIALGGLVSEELFLGESGTGPAADLASATELAAKMVGAFGMAGSLISYEALQNGPLSSSNLVAKVLGDADGKQRVEDILTQQKQVVTALLEENRDVVMALRDALLDEDELLGRDILTVIEKALANRN
ncbi:MAG: AAA family ATPase [Actinomycetota bacterium]